MSDKATHKLVGLVEEVAKDQKVITTTMQELTAANLDMQTRMENHEEKMAGLGVAGYGDVTPERAKYQRAFVMSDFLKVVASKTCNVDLPEEVMAFNQRKHAYPEEHYEKVLNATVGADGAYSVPEFMDNEIIKRLKSVQILEALGIRSFTVPEGFGSFAVPRLITGSDYTEGGEIDAPAISNQTLDLLTASPKQSFTGIEMSLALIGMNAVGLEDVILEDATEDGGLRADFLGLEGTGTAFQPRGLINVPGIGSVEAGSPNGGPVDVDLLINLQNEVEAANSMLRRTGYAMHSRVWHQLLKTREGAAPGSHIFPSVAFAPGIQQKPGKQVLGEQVQTFNEIDITGTKGSGTDLSTIYFGDWSDLMLIRWGTFSVKMSEEATHPVTGRSAFWEGLRVFRFAQTLDYITRQAGSFSVSTDVESQ